MVGEEGHTGSSRWAEDGHRPALRLGRGDTLAEYSVVGTGSTSSAAGLACRSRGSASGAARPLLGTRSTGAAAFRDGDGS